MSPRLGATVHACRFVSFYPAARLKWPGGPAQFPDDAVVTVCGLKGRNARTVPTVFLGETGEVDCRECRKRLAAGWYHRS